jgi:DNA helicase II / ATP-dependent DNA helicase PcrA
MGLRDCAYLNELNEPQRFAVTKLDQPVLILAGAGSGKTRTITYKIAYLIDQGFCKPQEILAVTFTNKAAEEMRKRVEGLAARLPAAPLIATFHSFAVRVLRRHAEELGFRNDFSICDTDDQKAVLKTIYKEIGLTDSLFPVKKARALISCAKNRGWGPDEYEAKSTDRDPEELLRIYPAYQRYLRTSNSMDFDDLLRFTVKLFDKHQRIRESYGARYRYLLIDEYQDTNQPQYRLIRLLTCLHQNISAVGDEDQSIYGFRGADINNILRFEKDFPGSVVVKLEQNYRSTQNILDAATAVASKNKKRKGKVLWTEHGKGDLVDLFVAYDPFSEAAFVAGEAGRRLSRGEQGIAVLYRTNFQSRQMEEAFRRADVPYKIVGSVSFYKRKEVRDAIAYLRVTLYPDDNVSLLRIINEPARGIGGRTLEKLNELARDRGTSLWGALEIVVEERLFPTRTVENLNRFRNMLERCRLFGRLSPSKFLREILTESGYLQALRLEATPEAKDRLQNLDELISLASEYERQGLTLQDLVDNATLRSEADDYDENAPVTLMTAHNAKGLEFPVVFLAGCEEGVFPHNLALEEGNIEEERRLFYVGLTRAQEKLYISYSRRRRGQSGDPGDYSQPSRFLSEIPEHLLQVTNQAFSFGPSLSSHRPSFPRSSQHPPAVTYNTPAKAMEFLNKLGSKKTAAGGFVKGARVFHEKYGRGSILQVEETGEDVKLTVQFPGAGIKKLIQRYARLRLI